MNHDSEILPCPNRECGAPCRVFDDEDMGFSVACDAEWACGYRGPYVPTEEEAIRLHNLICTLPAGWRLVPIDVAKIPHVAWDNAITAYQLATKKHGFYESCFAGYHAFLNSLEGES